VNHSRLIIVDLRGRFLSVNQGTGRQRKEASIRFAAPLSPSAGYLFIQGLWDSGCGFSPMASGQPLPLLIKGITGECCKKILNYRCSLKKNGILISGNSVSKRKKAARNKGVPAAFL